MIWLDRLVECRSLAVVGYQPSSGIVPEQQHQKLGELLYASPDVYES